LKIPNLDYLRSLDPKLFEAIKAIQDQTSNIEKQGNFNALGSPAAPPAIDRLRVTSGPGGEYQIRITDNGEVSRGINYWAEYDTSPNFTNPHIIDMGQTRNHSVNLGNQQLFWRAYSSYPSSDASPAVYHGSPTDPAPVVGGVPGIRSASEGAGTGAPGYGMSGPGPIPERSQISGYDWRKQRRSDESGAFGNNLSGPFGDAFGASGGSGGGSVSTWYQQIPIGTRNSVNRNFYLDYVPAPQYIILMVNGIVQSPYSRFSLTLNHITMAVAPKSTDEFVVWYFPGTPAGLPTAATLYLISAYVPDSPSPAAAAASMWDITVYGSGGNSVSVPYLSRGSLINTFTAYATVTNSYTLVPPGSAGHTTGTPAYAFDYSTVASLLSTVNLNFYCWNSSRTHDARVAEFRIYQAYMDITASGVTTRYYAGDYQVVPPAGFSGDTIVNPGNATDGDPSSYASINFADATGGLTGSSTPGFLRLFDFS
jgi:hypothetical protein